MIQLSILLSGRMTRKEKIVFGLAVAMAIFICVGLVALGVLQILTILALQ